MIKSKKIKLQIIYILIMVLFFSAAVDWENALAGDEIMITISAHEETAGPEILLQDIAAIRGASNSQKRSLGKISIGDAPRPGYHRTINRQKIVSRLREEGFNSEDYIIEMPALVNVRTRSILLAADHIIAYIENYIKKELPYPQEKIKIKIRFGVENLKIPDRMYTMEVMEKHPDKLLGNISLPVVIKCNEEVWKKIYIGLEVKVIQEVFIAHRSYMYGQKLEREDFKKERKELTRIRGDLILDWDNPLVKNGITSVPLGPGTVLTNHYLKAGEQKHEQEKNNNVEKLKIENVEEENNENNSNLKTVTVSDSTEKKEKENPYIINWGNEVQAEVIAGKVTVSAVVKARERGKKGEYISVENQKTGYKFRAKVISDRLVRVEL